MPLHSDFEALYGIILHRNPLPFVESMVSELLAKEICLKFQVRKGIVSISHTFVLMVPSRSPSNNQNKPYSRVAMDESSYCRQKGY